MGITTVTEKLTRTDVGICTGAVRLAAFGLPVHFLLCLYSWTEGSGMLLPMGVAILCGVLTAATVQSRKIWQCFAKLAASLPLTVLYWWIQVGHQLHQRGLNLVIRGYGDSWAGGGFASVVLLGMLALALFAGTAVGLLVTREQERPGFWRVLRIASQIIAAAVLIGILVLDCIMPQYHPVYG